MTRYKRRNINNVIVTIITLNLSLIITKHRVIMLLLALQKLLSSKATHHVIILTLECSGHVYLTLPLVQNLQLLHIMLECGL
jgi:hypothetical protein